MIYPIVSYGSPILRAKARNVAPHLPIEALVADMFATMDQAGGVGLAAPQIGKSLRLFVVNLTAFADASLQEDSCRKVYINPQLQLDDTDIQYEAEGCLSIPGIQITVPRAQRASITYTDWEGRLQQEVLTDMPARIIQHEYDHLEGKLHIDYARPLQRRLLKSKLAAIKMGKAAAAYRMQYVGKRFFYNHPD